MGRLHFFETSYRGKTIFGIDGATSILGYQTVAAACVHGGIGDYENTVVIIVDDKDAEAVRNQLNAKSVVEE